MRYYSTLRPITIGVLSNGAETLAINIVNFDKRQFVPAINREAWGFIETDEALPENEIAASELTPETVGLTEKQKRIAAAHILAKNGYSKKEAYHTAMEISKDGIDIYVTHYNGGYKNIVFKYYGWSGDYTAPLYTARVYSRLPVKYDFSCGQILTAKRNGNKRVIIHA